MPDLLIGCGSSGGAGGGSSSPVAGGNCLANGVSVSMTLEHGHVVAITTADIAAGIQKTYNIQGSGDHDHQVTITAADFANLQANQGIIEVSTTNVAHNHNITVNCA